MLFVPTETRGTYNEIRGRHWVLEHCSKHEIFSVFSVFVCRQWHCTWTKISTKIRHVDFVVTTMAMLQMTLQSMATTSSLILTEMINLLNSTDSPDKCPKLLAMSLLGFMVLRQPLPRCAMLNHMNPMMMNPMTMTNDDDAHWLRLVPQ